MHLIDKLRAVFAINIFAALSGCVVPQPRPNYHSSAEVREQLEQLRTLAPKEVQRRWGDFEYLVEKTWMYEAVAGSERYGMEFKWIVPGAVMDLTSAWCNRPECKTSWTVQYNANLHQLYFIGANGALDKVGVLRADGTIDVWANGFFSKTEEWKYDNVAKAFTLNAGALSVYKYREVPREQLVAVLNTHFKATSPAASNAMVASRKNATASAIKAGAARQPAARVTSTKANEGRALTDTASIESSQSTNSGNVRKSPKSSKSRTDKPNFGPFEAAVGNIYATKGGSALFTIIRKPDGSMALRSENFYNNSSSEFEIPPLSPEGIPKQENCILNFASDCTVILLQDGALRREQTLAHPDTKYRFVHEYRLADSSLISTTQYLRISGEGNSALEEKKTQTLERISPSDIQAIQDTGRQAAQSHARRMAELEAETARNKANAREWDEHFESVERQQRQNTANTWANIANAVQQDHNRMRNMENQMRSSSRQAIAAAEQSYSPPVRSADTPTATRSSGAISQPSAQPVAPRRPESAATAPTRTASYESPGAAKPSLNSAQTEKPAAPSRGPARAWCMKQKDGEFRCNGPLQNGGWGKSLEGALSMAGCPGGSGYTPTVGTGGQSFSCGRELRASERAVPTYDPFAKYKSNFEDGPVR